MTYHKSEKPTNMQTTINASLNPYFVTGTLGFEELAIALVAINSIPRFSTWIF
jgi:hypothetical protein